MEVGTVARSDVIQPGFTSYPNKHISATVLVNHILQIPTPWEL